MFFYFILGKELWKKRDWEGAKKMFETALEKVKMILL